MLERAIRTALNGTLPAMLMFVALAAGAFALIKTPREEEPQIVVPLADVLIEAPTLDAQQVERLVATPLEKLLAQIDGVEHVYSMSNDGRAMVTVRFFVGEDREDSLVKLYNKLLSNQDLVPPGLTSWVVKPVEIDDVPIVVATLWSDRVDDYDLRRLAQEIALDLQTVPDTNRIDVIGGRARELRVDIDPTAMAARNTAISDVLFALTASNVRMPSGQLQRANTQVLVETDARISDAASLAHLTVNVVDGVPVRISDIAVVYDGPAEPAAYNWITFGPAHRAEKVGGAFAAVDIAIAKKKGANAVVVARNVLHRLDAVSAQLFPAGVHYEITRNYGETADAKISDLIESLAVAVLSVVVLIGLFLGWRAALVVALAVPICYGFTLVLDYAAGYTINRVTLFALILALGLLVDDPIAGVDNIQRHLGNGRPNDDAITRAILEIRMPLVMSTLAIVIAFAPMRFITGMMGPYMSPMAFNVPVAVVFSTVVAFLVTPWLCKKLLRARPDKGAPAAASDLYARLVAPMLVSRRRSWLFLGALAVAFVVALTLPFLRVVPLKLLPHDNKNEFQVVIDAPEATTLEHTDAAAARIANYLTTVPEVRAVIAYSGNHSPMDFNGMVRHYYQREGNNVAELRVTLADKFSRPQQSHALALRLRTDIARIAAETGVIAKLVEVPPGPPVIAGIVAELYGNATTSYPTLIASARATAARLTREPGVVDVDVSAIDPAPRHVFVPDQEKAALSGVSAQAIATALEVVIKGRIATYVHAPAEAAPLPIRVQVPHAQRTDLGNLHIKGLPGIAKIRGAGGVTDAPTPSVSLAELGRFNETTRDQPIYHKDLRRVAYAFAEVAGRTPAEVIFDVDADRNTDGRAGTEAGTAAGAVARDIARRTFFASGGGDAWTLPAGVDISWSGEGEWDITLRVFRDLGIGFGVAILAMFLVIWWQTRRAALTAIILLAIPLTAIGIMPGFVLLNLVASNQIGAYADPVLFTATAMIGMIALAGIVVRNSLILIEFIEHERERGTPLDTALLRAGAMRARPVLLTAGTSVLGNLVITLDPIFSGLAWAIIFGVIASTAFTLLVVPVVYRLVYGGARHE